jgi:hypothetical protein
MEQWMKFETNSPYEVRCPRCDVSFPPKTRVCIHCGGRTAASPAGAGMGAHPVAGIGRQSTESEERILDFGLPGSELDIEAGDLDEEAPVPTRAGFMRTAITIVWVLLAIAFSIMRACSEGD